MHHLEPARSAGFANDDLRDVVCRSVGGDLIGDVAPRDRDRRRAEPFGEPEKVSDTVALGNAKAVRSGGLDINSRPRSA